MSNYMLKLAKRIQDIKESPTLAIAAKAKAMKAKGWDVIDFGAGEPDFDTPDNIKDAAIKAIMSGFQKYTAVGGTQEISRGGEKDPLKKTPGHLRDAKTPATKAVVINSPSNPTGTAYLPEELKAIADMAVKKGVFIISDEIYEKLCYDNHPFISVASFSEEIKRQTIVLNGVATTYS